MHMEGYRCLVCDAYVELSHSGMVCPSCGGNLDVVYNYENLKSVIRNELSLHAQRSDIFRYLPLLPVEDASLASPLHVGGTPLYRASRLGRRLDLDRIYIKDDGMNPTSSFKDRAGAIALVKARMSGAKVIAGASTGNAGSSIAGLCASVGQACVVFVPESAPRAKLIQLRSYGARVIAVRGTYDQAYDLCSEVSRRHGWFNRNTGMNPFTREGKKTSSFEMWEQLDNGVPDRVVVSAGDGNIISGIWKGWRDLYRVGLIERLPRIDCIQAAGSAAIVRAIEKVRNGHSGSASSILWRDVVIDPVAADTMADSISVDMPRDGMAAVRAVIESGGHAVTVTDEQIRQAQVELAGQGGIFTEPASAAAWAGLAKMAGQGMVRSGETMVCLLTGNGLKDAAKIEPALPALPVVEPDPSAVDPVIRDLL